MNTYELIKKKRDGQSLSTKEIGHLIEGYTNGHIPDYQMAAFLMSVYFKAVSYTHLTLPTIILPCRWGWWGGRG